MTLVMSCRCLSQSYVGRSIGEECALPVSDCLPVQHIVTQVRVDARHHPDRVSQWFRNVFGNQFLSPYVRRSFP